jgi:hypothetical protein
MNKRMLRDDAKNTARVTTDSRIGGFSRGPAINQTRKPTIGKINTLTIHATFCRL